MLRVEEQILIYSVLVPEERQALDALVAERPHLVPLLEASRQWDALFDDGRLLLAPEPCDEALAYFVVTRRLDQHPLPPRLRRVFEQLEARVAAQPALRARVDVLEQRRRELESTSDPAVHFQRLSGRGLPA